VRPNDVVVGIAAAGTTPFVLAALREAKKRAAFTVALTANRRAPISKIAKVTIAPFTGPEAVAGSTRMKAGTAQKLVLNMLSTTAMIRMGYVYDNWMVNVAATNQKLRRRALRILEEAADTNLYTAEHALSLAGHDLRTALVMLKSGVTANEARALLKSAHENTRIALQSVNKPNKKNRLRNSDRVKKGGHGSL
jgi:N-acetylmuramic acid 6-phosphate etherase